MKKLAAIAFVLLFVASVWPQARRVNLDEIRPEFLTVTLDSTASSIVYYIFPPLSGTGGTNRNAPSITAPTSASAQAQNLSFNSSGALTIAAVLDTSTAQESDSLYMYAQTLWYDKTKATWYRSANDTLYLDFDTPGTYTGTSIDYLDWTHGVGYTANLGGDIMPGAGVALTVGQYANNNAGAYTNVYLSFWFIR